MSWPIRWPRDTSPALHGIATNGDVSAQTPVHDAHPDKDAYMTECSGGDWEPSWERSLRWFTQSLIIGSTRGWSRGVHALEPGAR